MLITNSETFVEAKLSVDRLVKLVNEQYQEMTSRVHALERNGLNRLTAAPSALRGYGDLLESKVQGDLWSSPANDPASAADADAAEFSFWEELEKSRVYRNITTARTSTFSIDQCTMTLSCLSSFSLAEVSQLSVINLAVSAEEVYNPHRLSQSWSNEQSTTNPLGSLPLQAKTAIDGTTLDYPHTRLKPPVRPARSNSNSSSINTLVNEVSNRPSSVGISSAPNSEAIPVLSDLHLHESAPAWQHDFFRCTVCTVSLKYDESYLTSIGPLKCDFCEYNCSLCHKNIEDRAILSEDHAFCTTCLSCSKCKKVIEDSKYTRTAEGMFCMTCHESYMRHNCSLCHKSIEDRAIRSGDRAFCTTCLKCSKCKKVIEDLKYTRTAQGMFCMTCHESYMGRRRKKAPAEKIGESKSGLFATIEGGDPWSELKDIEESSDPPWPIYLIALYDYDRDSEDGLSFRRGDIIQLIETSGSGWWEGISDGVRGWFPDNLCELISEADAVGLIDNDDHDYDYKSTDPESGHADFGDFIAVGELCWKVYKKFEKLSGDSDHLSIEISSLQAVIKETEKSLLEQSLLEKQGARLQQLRQGCQGVLQDLIRIKYLSLEIEAHETLDGLASEVDCIRDIRQTINSYISMLKIFISTYVIRFPVLARLHSAES